MKKILTALILMTLCLNNAQARPSIRNGGHVSNDYTVINNSDSRGDLMIVAMFLVGVIIMHESRPINRFSVTF